MKIYYYTFGCKVNQYETEHIREKFEQEGHATVKDIASADVCVINSCTVTEQADQKCLQMLRRIRKTSPRAVTVLAGCFPQAFKEKAEGLTECDIIVGTENKGNIPELTDRFMKTGERIVSISEHTKDEKIDSMTNKCSGEKTRSYIKIQDGCDCYCSYCIIPYARGHVRSKPLNDVINEAKQNIAAGHKELILTGINLCFYGKDLPERPTLTDVIESICSLEGEFRVRLGSIEPEMMLEDDIKRLTVLDKLCPHFHLSLQSGSDSILKAMNRRYDSKEYSVLCRSLREYFPNCAITTDIMVGFPGEDDKAFEESLSFAREIAFADAHIFPYSRRAGTKANDLPGQVPQHIKHERAKRMAEVCAKTKADYLSGCVEKVFEVLFERETEAEWHSGHAPNYVVVKVPRVKTDDTWRRQIRKVRITSADGEFCYGEVVQD
ncbi:MAG: tRNA (N(6)-L-threonylcarbamoyladenosine(37)-C(2))-methylthiotransferase MtaB [Ruminococcus sp.]|uniref:tRNA (N(6)-L-threonylcarbamoyladenosine(37)-C(2))- methylthiotransferase MtaB n=1 Tax=Ruminococcus sp. TaxID=41978 RepID=UPI0025F4C61B|nr:tRNA (N(6)-L-threonylcarbamoyladenosine(37)-C(2))-methylthiotransferase MtaB [Ruminococcus sp.]MCR5541001.1 tRNA (N(6)-L-threonylcarbamoyladenosine(37)-C(2))-methylthiotransferase MtaB [Ruminococcus sp.]